MIYNYTFYFDEYVENLYTSPKVNIFKSKKDWRTVVMRKELYERKVSLIDGLALQGASVEELAFFFNMDNEKMLVLMEMECIDVIHRDLTNSKRDYLEETRSDFIRNLSVEERLSDKDISLMFNITLKQVKYYKEPFTEMDELIKNFEAFKASRKK